MVINFAYAQPASVSAATASLARHCSDSAHEQGADFLAGGTDMVQLMTEHLRNPGRVIDISALPGSTGSSNVPIACGSVPLYE